MPLSAFAIYGALALPYVGGSRFVARYLFLRSLGRKGRPVARVAIYGAGNAGARVCSILLGGPDFEPIAFIDDKKSLQRQHQRRAGIRPEELPDLVRQRRIDRVLLAFRRCRAGGDARS